MVVLLVDDDVAVQLFIWKLLNTDGFTVLTADDGTYALAASRNYPGTIDLVLSDVEMPRMDGLELCRNLTNERPEIKVLMMSGALEGREQVSMSGLAFLQSRSPIRPCGMPSKRCLAPFGLCYDGDPIPSTA